ncbi:MAG: hypothetical protein WDZ83_01640 [Rhizobiaceae bacterium]
MNIFTEIERQLRVRAIAAWENEGGAPRRGSPDGQYGGSRATGGMLNARNAPRHGQRIRLPVGRAHSPV